MNPENKTFSDPIAPVSLTQITEALSHDVARSKIKAIFEECTGAVIFQDLVMEYAGKEIDRRQLGTFKFWGITILVAAVTAIITALLATALVSHGYQHP